MRIALISLNQHWQNRSANFERCEDLIGKAAGKGCELAIFPEMTLTGYSLDVSIVAESVDTSESLSWFGQLSRKFGVHLIFGACLLNRATRQPQNVLCHADPSRDATPIYAKIHPFSFAGEDRILGAGDALGFVELPGIRLGATICYDLRFPELYAAMASRCEGAICIANWPARRKAHWHTLLVARAIENQMFLFGVNRIGTDGNGLEYEKSSMVVTPSGEVMKPIFESLELDLYEINPDETLRYRNEFPTLRDKRHLVYEKL